MRGGQERFAIGAEAKDSHCGDHGGGAGACGQSARATPGIASAIAGRSDVPNAFDEARTVMLQEHDGALREAGDVACAAGAGQSDFRGAEQPPDGVEIAEAVHFRSAQKSDVYAALLKERHHVQH